MKPLFGHRLRMTCRQGKTDDEWHPGRSGPWRVILVRRNSIRSPKRCAVQRFLTQKRQPGSGEDSNENISRRSTQVESRSLITGEAGVATVQMINSKGRSVGPNDVMFTVGKLSRMSRSDEELSFDNDVGKIVAVKQRKALNNCKLKWAEFSKLYVF